MRIWWQSFVDQQSSRPYLDNLTSYLNEKAQSGVTVDVFGMSPPARGWSRLSELRGAVHSVHAALQAQERGYDGFVIGHFQEPGLYETRSAVDLPVIGLGESVLLWSTQLGRNLGLVSVDSVFTTIHEEQVAARGLATRLAGVAAINASLEEFDQAFDPEGYQRLRSRFEVAAAALVERGADVIIPAGGLFGMASAHEVDFQISGVPVVPSVLVALEWAQMTIRVFSETAIRPSQRSSFRLASADALADFRDFVSDAESATPHR